MQEDNTANSVDSTVDNTQNHDEATVTDTSAQDTGENQNADATVADQTAKETKPEDKQQDDATQEPGVRNRKTPKDFIIERQQRKIEKMKSQGVDQGNDNDGEGDDAERRITESILEGISPVLQEHLKSEDAREVSEFLTENPDFAPYKDRVLQFMQHPSRRQLPVDSIFYEVAGPDLLRLGAERSKKAEEAAKQTQAGGTTDKAISVKKSAWEMTDEEFKAEQHRVLHGG